MKQMSTMNVVNARLQSLDFDCMAEYNKANNAKRVQARFVATNDKCETDNALTALLRAHTTTQVYTIVLNFDGVVGVSGQPITDAEIKASIDAAVKECNGVVPLTVVTVPLSVVSDYTDVYTEDGKRISQQVIAFVGVGDYLVTAENAVRAQVAKRIASGAFLTENPTATTEGAQGGNVQH